MSATKVCHQVNLQLGFGGGEVYTVFFTRALLALGWQVVLYVNPANRDWPARLPTGVTLVPLAGVDDLPAALPAAPSVVFFHTPQPAALIAAVQQRAHRCCVFAHMPLYGRNPAWLMPFDYVVAVSAHVINSLLAAGISHHHPEPMLGVADLERGAPGAGFIRRGALYDWDRRKVRERLGRVLSPLVGRLLPRPSFARKPGLNLGIVSRLTPIKQFPLLFSHLAPVLAEMPDVNLEIFGSGGYASVRDLRLALKPLGGRCRFWGQQEDVRLVYAQLDAMLTGLPEKEALGLNVIEAQVCGLPVLAVDAPPFDETVADGLTGWRYVDPRLDAGADFRRVLGLLRHGLQADPAEVERHLARFSMPAFIDRVDRLMRAIPDNPHAA
jgi:glycosyltransferase involved in cell wall biosynthesis